jgi:two-component sensor histidine kinase
LSERDTARITVRIMLDGDTVQLEFQDDGPGYPETVLRMEQQSVGFKLIKNIVQRNLRGELSLRNDSGAVTIIRFECIQNELEM